MRHPQPHGLCFRPPGPFGGVAAFFTVAPKVTHGTQQEQEDDDAADREGHDQKGTPSLGIALPESVAPLGAC